MNPTPTTAQELIDECAFDSTQSPLVHDANLMSILLRFRMAQSCVLQNRINAASEAELRLIRLIHLNCSQKNNQHITMRSQTRYTGKIKHPESWQTCHGRMVSPCVYISIASPHRRALFQLKPINRHISPEPWLGFSQGTVAGLLTWNRRRIFPTEIRLPVFDVLCENYLRTR